MARGERTKGINMTLSFFLKCQNIETYGNFKYHCNLTATYNLVSFPTKYASLKISLVHNTFTRALVVQW